MIDLKLFFGKDENYTKSTFGTNMGANTVKPWTVIKKVKLIFGDILRPIKHVDV